MVRINIPLLINRVVHYLLHHTYVLTWVNCLCKPLSTLQEVFLSFRKQKLLELTYNSQTMIFERVLNTAFGATGIYIENVNSSFNRNYIFQLSEEERPLYIRQLNEEENGPFINSLAEFASEFDFIVWVPVGLVFDQAKMNALVNKYKLAGFRHSIQKY
jgi:hypothetical protein